MVRRLRSWFGPGEFDTVVAERAVALAAARGPLPTRELAGEVFALLGGGWRRGEDPITVHDVEHTLYALLPGATLLADLV